MFYRNRWNCLSSDYFILATSYDKTIRLTSVHFIFSGNVIVIIHSSKKWKNLSCMLLDEKRNYRKMCYGLSYLIGISSKETFCMNPYWTESRSLFNHLSINASANVSHGACYLLKIAKLKLSTYWRLQFKKAPILSHYIYTFMYDTVRIPIRNLMRRPPCNTIHH